MKYRVVKAEELYHHGILGQQWGERNGPPYPLDAGDHSASERQAGWKKSLKSRGKVQRQLNKMDKQQAKYLDKYQSNEYMARKAMMKGAEARNKGKEKRADKYYEKAQTYALVSNLYLSDLKRSESFTNQYLANAIASGYDISVKKITRDARAGERFAANLLGGLAGNIGYTVFSNTVTGSTGMVEGNKYKVRKGTGSLRLGPGY